MVVDSSCFQWAVLAIGGDAHPGFQCRRTAWKYQLFNSIHQKDQSRVSRAAFASSQSDLRYYLGVEGMDFELFCSVLSCPGSYLLWLDGTDPLEYRSPSERSIVFFYLDSLSLSLELSYFLPSLMILWMPSTTMAIARGAKQAKRLRASSIFSCCSLQFSELAAILIQTQVQSIGPHILMMAMKQTAIAKRLCKKQQTIQTNRLQQVCYSSSPSLITSSQGYLGYLGYLGYYDFRDDLLEDQDFLRSLAYYLSCSCLPYKKEKEGTRIKQRMRKEIQRYTIASMKAGFLTMLATSKVERFYEERRHIQIKESSPKPKPLRSGPKRKIQKTFQQLFLESAMEPVMQMKKRMVSMGQRMEMIQAPTLTSSKQESVVVSVKKQKMMQMASASVVESEVNIMMGQLGLKLVCMSRYCLNVIFLRSAMQESGALVTLLIALSIYLKYQNQLPCMRGKS